MVAGYWDPIKGKYGEVVGEAGGDFAPKGADHAEYNLVADAIREQMGVDFDIENMGGVRSPLAKGPITYADMVNMDPFGNTIVTFRATGKQIKQMLMQDRPAVSGIRYTYAKGDTDRGHSWRQAHRGRQIYAGATNNYYARSLLKDITDKTDTKRRAWKPLSPISALTKPSCRSTMAGASLWA